MRYLALVAVPTVLAAAFFYAASESRHTVSAQDFVNLQQGNTVHQGFRRAHAKGFCVSGEFVSSGAMAEYSNARVLQAGQHPFIGRFSIGGNNPAAPDLASPVRSLALTLLPETADQWRIAMNTPPVLAVGTPEKFYQQLLALQTNTIAEFFAAHPETDAFRRWRASYQPTQSYATEQYHGINAFYLVNASGAEQAVRWAAVPTVQPDNQLADPEAPDALQQELFARLAQAPVIFDLVFSLATSADNPADATVSWPQTNPQLVAGQLHIKQATEQQNGECNAINFDPLVLPTGIKPSADPILRARGAAYAESHRRRAREVLINSVAGTQHE